MSEKELQQLTERWKVLKRQREQLELQDNDLKAEIDSIRQRIFELFEQLGTAQMKFPEGTVFLVATAYPKVVGDPDQAIDWFDKQKWDVAPRTIKAARIKEYFEEAMEKDLPLPPDGLVDLTPAKEVRLRENKSKGDKK